VREDFENVHGITSPKIVYSMSFNDIIEIPEEMIISEDFASGLR